MGKKARGGEHLRLVPYVKRYGLGACRKMEGGMKLDKRSLKSEKEIVFE